MYLALLLNLLIHVPSSSSAVWTLYRALLVVLHHSLGAVATTVHCVPPIVSIISIQLLVLGCLFPSKQSLDH